MQMKRTDGWALGSAVFRCCCLIIRVMELKNRAMSQYGGGRGGVVSKIKRFRQTPLLNIDVMGRNYYFSNVKINLKNSLYV